MTTVRLTRHPRPAASAAPVPAHRRSRGSVSAPRGRVRLALMDRASARRTTLDGVVAAQPEPVTGVPALVEELHRRGVRATRVAYSPAGWDAAPRLTGDLTRTRLDPLVLPPEATGATAGRGFAAATTPGNDRSPTALLADLTPSRLWQSEGGNTSAAQQLLRRAASDEPPSPPSHGGVRH
jgi:hypothetical protein